jgi:hypothetical protein
MAGYIESQPQYKYAEWGSLTCPPNPDATKGTDIVCHADGMQVDKASSHGEDILVTITSYNMDFNWTYTQSGPDTGVNK